ncbi:MAG: hypothetical protein IT320_26975 [Anaerolineae bacterium]|nr:hypothetical protein [Anaerolineae bacterium]
MTRKQIVIALLVLVAVFVAGALAASAQGNGPGPGGAGGQGGMGTTNPQTPGDCPYGCDPQANNAQNSGMGMMNGGHNGMRWDDQTRGNMGSNRGQGMGLYGNLPPAVAGDLSDDVIAAMTAGLMDEYNAYAIYGGVIEQFGAVAPFINIQNAEAQHIAAWQFLFDRYSVAVPAAPQTDVPAFASLTDACQAAADAEIANFGLYDDMLVTLADYPDMVQVVTSLRDASEFQHLPAFEQCAAR